MKPKIYKYDGKWWLKFKPYGYSPIRVYHTDWFWLIAYLDYAYRIGEVDRR